MSEVWKEGREDHPQEYALTKAEARRVVAFHRIISAAVSAHPAKDAENRQGLTLTPESMEAIAAACKQKRVSLAGIARLADKVFSYQWYTLVLAADPATLAAMEDGYIAHYLITKESYAENKLTVVKEPLIIPTREEIKAGAQMTLFNMNTILETRQQLHVPDGYRFLYEIEFEALLSAQLIIKHIGTEKPVIVPQGFRTIRQGPVTNTLATINTSRQKALLVWDELLDAAKITRNGLTVSFDNYKAKHIEQGESSILLLDYLIMTATEQGMKKQTIITPLRQYMNTRGITDENKARKQIAEDQEVLFSMRLSYKGKGKKNAPFLDVRIASAKGIITNGDIIFSFTNEFFALLKQYTIMPLPEQYFKLRSNHNPNSRAFLRKLAEQKNMNGYKTAFDIVSVQTLLDIAPALPKYEEIAAKGQVAQRIIEPFERDLDALSDTLTWEYCHSGGVPLTDAELDKMTYAVFSKLLLRVVWRDYPDQSQRAAAHQRRLAAAAQAAEQPKRKRGRPRKNPEA